MLVGVSGLNLGHTYGPGDFWVSFRFMLAGKPRTHLCSRRLLGLFQAFISVGWETWLLGHHSRSSEVTGQSEVWVCSSGVNLYNFTPVVSQLEVWSVINWLKPRIGFRIPGTLGVPSGFGWRLSGLAWTLGLSNVLNVSLSVDFEIRSWVEFWFDFGFDSILFRIWFMPNFDLKLDSNFEKMFGLNPLFMHS